MAKIDDVLRLLENGKWHDLREMEENTQLHDCDVSSILRFLVQYDFIKLDKEGKKAYKEAGNKIIYSFHATEVECIGKGKLNKPYEFGNKVGIAISGEGNFILGVKSFHGNPYDASPGGRSVVRVGASCRTYRKLRPGSPLEYGIAWWRFLVPRGRIQ